MKLREIAPQILEHLKRMEADPKINVQSGERSTKLPPFWDSNAVYSGRYVYVTYVRYENISCLTKEQAEKYLAWLDAGNNGKHWEALAKADGTKGAA